jgi:thiol-disulfide isomerase/thioredoxin
MTLKRAEAMPEAPWEWAVRPMETATSFVSGAFQCILVEGQAAITAYLFTPPQPDWSIRPQFRPVVLNGDGARHALVRKRGGGSDLGFLHEYASTGAVELRGVWQIGVERLTVAAQRQVALDAAAVSPHTTLPFPEVGKPYAFVLDTDGGACTSEACNGKVVLIHCWHTGCGSCLAETPTLKALQAKYGDDLVVLGANFDTDRSKALVAVERYGMAWPQVYVPDDESVREAWRVVASIAGFPRHFVVGRDGVLRRDIMGLESGTAVDEVVEGK